MWIVQYQDTYKLYPFKHTTSSQAHTLLTFSTDLSLSPIKREPFPGPFKKTKSVVLSLSRQHHGLPRASLKWHVTRPYHQWILHPMSSMKMTIASSGNGWGNQINDVFTYLGTLESSGKRKAISNLVHIDLPKLCQWSVEMWVLKIQNVTFLHLGSIDRFLYQDSNVLAIFCMRADKGKK